MFTPRSIVITYDIGPRAEGIIRDLFRSILEMGKAYDDIKADLDTLAASQAAAVAQQAETLGAVQKIVGDLKAQVSDLTAKVTALQQSLDSGALTPEEADAIKSQIANLTAQANSLRDGIRAIDPGDAFTVHDIPPAS